MIYTQLFYTKENDHLSIVFAIRMSVSLTRRWWDFDLYTVVMFIFLLLKTAIKLLRNNCINSFSLLASQRIKSTISIMIHIMRSHITSYLRVFIHSFQFLSLWISIVLKGNRIVGQTLSFLMYPLELPVLLAPIIWLIALNYSRSLIFCW